ncbi:MAG: hypothetical protein H0X17_14790 [Deltaproteobacteria bacterium]|nr:hypothetical protein [Deltaproteobacteria bacterium]
MRSLIVAACLLPACDRVFLDELPPEVTVSYEVREVRNAPDGTPATTVVSDPRFFEVVLADGSMPSLVTRNEGALTFVRGSEQEPYRLAVRMPNDQVVEYQLATPSVSIVDAVIGRNDRAPPAGWNVRQLVPNAPANTTSYLVTTGLWTETPHTAAQSGTTNMSFQFEWPNARRKFGAAGILAAPNGDRAYATSSVFGPGKRGAPYFSISHICEDTFETLGLTVDIELQCNVAPIATDRCLHLQTAFAAELDRIAEVLPPIAHLTKHHGWFVGAAPAPELAPQVTLDLASGFAFTDAAKPATETDDELSYGNPFPGHAVNLKMVASHERPYTDPKATSHTNLETRTRYWTAPAPTCGTPEPVPSLVAIPHGVLVDEMPLDEDGRIVATDPARDLRVTWSDSAGSVDFYRVVLTEVAEFLTFTIRVPRRTYVVTERTVLVDPNLLQPTKTYVIEVEAHAGAPNARRGEFGTHDPAAPYAIGSGWSSTFQVP